MQWHNINTHSLSALYATTASNFWWDIIRHWHSLTANFWWGIIRHWHTPWQPPLQNVTVATNKNVHLWFPELADEGGVVGTIILPAITKYLGTFDVPAGITLALNPSFEPRLSSRFFSWIWLFSKTAREWKAWVRDWNNQINKKIPTA